MSGGPNNELGFFVGKTTRAAVLEARWNSAVLVGVEDESRSIKSIGLEEESAIACHLDRKIKSSDWLIFVGRTSNPQRSDEPADLADFKAQVDKLMLASPSADEPRLRFAGGTISSSSSKSGEGLSRSGEPVRKVGLARRLGATNLGKVTAEQHVLVMGWRPEWNSTPASLRQQIRNICEGLPPGSTVTCLNVKSPRDFDELLCQQAKSEDSINKTVAWPANKVEAATMNFGSGWEVLEATGDRTIKVFHHCGDPVHFESVAAFMRKPGGRVFDTAICLGNVVGASLPADAQDSRVLSMFLILREITELDAKWRGRSIRIISENQIDQTAHLAVVPRRASLSSNPFSSTDLDKDEPAPPDGPMEPETPPGGTWAVVHDWATPLVILPSPTTATSASLSGGSDGLATSVVSNGSALKAASSLASKLATKKAAHGGGGSSTQTGAAAEEAADKAGGKTPVTAVDQHLLFPGEKFCFDGSKIVMMDDDSIAIFYELSDGASSGKKGWVHDLCDSHSGRRAIQVLADAGAAGSRGTPEPDLMNTNAIVARALASVLAYPQIEPSVMELVSTSTGTVQIEFYPPQALGLLQAQARAQEQQPSASPNANNATGGGVAFGVVQHILDALYAGEVIAVGYILAKDGRIQLAPPTGKPVAWVPADRVIVLIRHAERPDKPKLHSLKSETAAMQAWTKTLNKLEDARVAPPSLEATQAKVEANLQQTATVLKELAEVKRQLASLGAKESEKAVASSKALQGTKM